MGHGGTGAGTLVAGLRPHWEATPASLIAGYREVSAALVGSDFRLAGGTALALHLGHRTSVDLDLFSVSFDAPDATAAILRRRLADLVVRSTAPRTLHVSVGAVQVSLFGYDYPWLLPPVEVETGLLPVASVDDISAMKLAAVASRGSRKDFVDLWCVLRSGRSLSGLLSLYQQKYTGHDVGHVIRSLTYFDDAEQDPPLNLLAPAPWDEVKADLTGRVRELVAAQ